MYMNSMLFFAVFVFTVQVFGQDYSINLMWVNGGGKSKFIFSDEEEVLREKFLKVAFLWGELNPGRDIRGGH